jgi:hypothetical protein
MIFDMADIKPSVLNLAMVTLMAIIGITFLKWATMKFPIRGFSELVAAV